MLQHIHKLLDEADAVIHFNGKAFDIPVLNREFVIAKMPPPSPAKDIDLLQTARQRFRFASNKLDYISQALGVGRKVEHTGYQLWVDCLAGDEKAWKLMEKYNRNDVILLQNVYERLLPWIKNHPNLNLYEEHEGCPRCGSAKMQKRGVYVTSTQSYQRWSCSSCGGWSRSRASNKHKVTKVAV